MPTPPSDSKVKWHKTAFTNPLMSAETIEQKTKKYKKLLEANLQARLVAEAWFIRAKLLVALGSPVTVLTPPDQVVSQIFGEDKPRILNGEKTWEGSEVKVIKEYEGDWDQAKDLARCTLVVESKQHLLPAWRIVLGHFFANVYDRQGANGFKLHSFKEKKRDDPKNPCGYTDFTVYVQSGGFIAEIQVNYVAMMYAKSKPEFIGGFGQDRAREVGAIYREVPGFLGHELYEVYRDEQYKDKEKAKAVARASKAYFDYFRSDPADYGKGRLADRLLRDVGVIRSIALPKAPKRIDKYASRLDELLGPDAPDGRARPIDIKPGNFKDLFGVERSLP